MIAIRDQPGTSPDDPFAHGSGFDRIAAFQDGFENGAQKCKEYADEQRGPAHGRDPFDPAPSSRPAATSPRGRPGPRRRGPAHPARAGPQQLLRPAVRRAGQRVRCPGRRPGAGRPGHRLDHVRRASCPAARARAWRCTARTRTSWCSTAPGLVTDLNDDIGDFAVAAEVGALWALAAQIQLGVADGEQAALQADCLTGGGRPGPSRPAPAASAPPRAAS